MGEKLELDTRICPLHVPNKCCTDVLVNILGGSCSIEEELNGCQDPRLLKQIERFLNWVLQVSTNGRVEVILIQGSVLDGFVEGPGNLERFKGDDNFLLRL